METTHLLNDRGTERPQVLRVRATALAWLMIVTILLMTFVPAGMATAADSQVPATVYFGLNLPTKAGLVPVTVLLAGDGGPERAALAQLIAGPPAGAALTSMIPSGTEVLGLAIADGLATVNFSHHLTEGSVGSLGEALLLGAIVNTLTGFPTIDRVWILVDGQAPGSVGGHIEITEPLQFNRAVILSIGLDDILGHWAEGSIAALYLAGIVSGYPDAGYLPERNVSREEFVKMLVVAAGLGPRQVTTPTFQDVAPERWSSGVIEAAVAAGIVIPSDHGLTFAPQTQIGRREMATMLVRAAGQEALASSLVNAPLPYTDVADLPGWARGHVAAATQLGLMQGYPDGTFGPDRVTRRSETASVINRFLAVGEEQIRIVGPRKGAQTSASQVLVWGVARVFEATVQARVRDGDGAQVAEVYCTATEGAPGWGIYGALLPTPVAPGEFTVQAFEYSAKDGAEINMVARQVMRLP